MLSKTFNILAATLACSSVCYSMPTVERRDNTATPRNVLYVQTFTDSNNNFYNLTDLATQSTGVTHVILASLHLDSPTELHLNDNDITSSYWDPVWTMVSALQASGIKVMLMMGGAATGSWANLDSDFDSYYPPIKSVLQDHNLDGFDFDIEEDVSQDTVVKFAQQLDSDFGTDFILTGAPVASAMSGGGNLDNLDWSSLDSAATSSSRPNGKLFNWFNTQFYDGWGDASSTSSYDAIISAGWDASRIVLGVLTSSGDGSGYDSLDTLTSTISSLKSSYSNFGGVSGWEYGGAGSSDNDDPDQWVAAISSALA